jgi:drug/metabolite transporter (DMT)-like permease
VFRLVYALPVLFALWLAVRRRDRRDRAARGLAAAAGLLLAADLTFWHYTIEFIGAGLATVLVNTQVLFVGLAAWFVHRERPTRTALWVVPAMLGGVALISGLGRSDAYGEDPLAGVLAGVTAGAFYASYIMLLRTSNRRFLAPSAGPMFDATLGAALGGVLVAAVGIGDFTAGPSWPAHGWLVVLALVVQVAGWMLITVALPRLPALETSAMILLQPVGALVWGRIFFDETLSGVQAAGVVVVLAGLALLSLRGSVEPHPARPVARNR